MSGPVAMQATVTEDEARVLDMTANMWNAFMELPPEHAMEQAEMCAAVHTVQNIILARAARRAIKARYG